MGVVLALLRNDRAAYEARQLERREGFVIKVPDPAALACDALGLFQLSPEKRGGDFAREVRRTHIHPAVLIHLAEGELFPVGALFPKDLGPLDQPGIRDEQSPSFAGNYVFGLVEAQSSELPYPAERSSLVRGHQSMCRVFDHQ